MKKRVKMLLCLLCVLAFLTGLAACNGSLQENGAEINITEPKIEAPIMAGFGKVDVTPAYDPQTGLVYDPIPLAGYGTTEIRMQNQKVLSHVYISCIALTDDQGNTVLLMALDLSTIPASLLTTARQLISEATGVPGGSIILTASHTHSGPDVTKTSYPSMQKYREEIFFPGLVKAAVDAMEDRAEATMWTGSVTDEEQPDLKNLNSVRHYYYYVKYCDKCDYTVLNTTDSAKCGKCGSMTLQLVKKYFGDGFLTRSEGIKVNGEDKEAVWEAYRTAHILQFQRANKDDIALVNWRAHPHLTGGHEKSFLSADYVGAFRDALEQTMAAAGKNTQVIYFQGAAGNINETVYDTLRNLADGTMEPIEDVASGDYLDHGKRLAAVVAYGIENNMTQVAEPGLIKVTSYTFREEGQNFAIQLKQLRNYSPEYAQMTDSQLINILYQTAVTVRQAYATPRAPGVSVTQHMQLALKTDEMNIINSTSHANSIYSVINAYYKKDAAGNFVYNPYFISEELNTIIIGDAVGMITAPHELFDQTTVELESRFKGKLILTLGYAGANGYLPVSEAWDGYVGSDGTIYTPYEANICKFAQGTAEKMEDTFEDMLQLLWSEEHAHCFCYGKSNAADKTGCQLGRWETMDASKTEITVADGQRLTLGADMTVKLTVPNGAKAHLCLQGHTLTLTETLNLGSGSKLTICDCVGTGRILGKKENIIAVNDTTNDTTGALCLYSGSISGEKARRCLQLSKGYVYQYGGVITDGFCAENGGNLLMTGGRFYQEDGVIQNGVAANGGNIAATGGSAWLFDGVVQNGIASQKGGNMYFLNTTSQFKKVSVLNGSAGLFGNSIYFSGVTRTLNLGDCTISQKKDASAKENIYIATMLDLKLMGACKILGGEYAVWANNIEANIWLYASPYFDGKTADFYLGKKTMMNIYAGFGADAAKEDPIRITGSGTMAFAKVEAANTAGVDAYIQCFEAVGSGEKIEQKNSQLWLQK